MLQSPTEGRYQVIHERIAASDQDLKGSTGILVSFPVTHNYILITQFGFEIMSAPGAVTVAAIVQLWKQPVDNGTAAILNSLATLTFDNTKSAFGFQVVSAGNGLNAGASNSPPTRSYPLAVRGDVIQIRLTTQGTGAGAQSVRPWFHFREMPAGSVQG